MQRTSTFQKLMQMIAVIVALMATVLAALNAIQFQRKSDVELERQKIQIELLERQADLTVESNNIRSLIEDRVKQIVETQVSKSMLSDGGDILLKVADLEKTIVSIKSQTTGLRQAINPENPEEILTIARISDRLEALSKDMKQFEERIQNEQTRFRESLQREVQSSNNATNLIIVALIPLVLNLVYNIWKDTRIGRGENGDD